MLSTCTPAREPARAPGPEFQPQPPGSERPQSAPESQLDQPLRWLYEARRNYTQVRDYTCTLRKQERVRGILQEENIILFSFREKPFSVHMKWLVPPKWHSAKKLFTCKAETTTTCA